MYIFFKQQTQFSLWDLFVSSIALLLGGCIFILGTSGTTVGLKKEREMLIVLSPVLLRNKDSC